MLTKNGYALIATRIFSNGKIFSVRKTTGETGKLFPSSSLLPHYDMQNLKTVTTSNGVVLGTGTTPPTLDDYKMAGDIFTTFTYTAAVTPQETDEGYECTAIYTITNSGTADFTISEIGLLSTFYTASSSGNGAFLVDRTVLDTPVTIPAGGIGQVTYTIRMNYPTA